MLKKLQNRTMPKDRPQCGLILENSRGEVLLQLREDKPSIPYPNCLGTFGGQIEPGETPEEALVREIREELEYHLIDFEYMGNFPFEGYDIHMYRKVDKGIKLEDLVIREGQKAVFVSVRDIHDGSCNFAFNCKEIVRAYYKKYHQL